MVINNDLLYKVKTSLRLSHGALDAELADIVNSCLADLRVCGVKVPKLNAPADGIDPLILNAIKLYCRSEFTDDTVKAAAYRARYDSMKSCLMMATGYREEAAADE